MDPALTGLTAFLAEGPAGSSGLMIVEYVVQDLLARLRTLAAPVTTAGAVISLGVEDHASFSTQAARAVRELSDLLPTLFAGELLAAVRALRGAPERRVRCPALALYDEADPLVDARHRDHVLGPELTALADLVRRRAGSSRT